MAPTRSPPAGHEDPAGAAVSEHRDEAGGEEVPDGPSYDEPAWTVIPPHSEEKPWRGVGSHVLPSRTPALIVRVPPGSSIEQMPSMSSAARLASPAW
jgi:hypothetical protein